MQTVSSSSRQLQPSQKGSRGTAPAGADRQTEVAGAALRNVILHLKEQTASHRSVPSGGAAPESSRAESMPNRVLQSTALGRNAAEAEKSGCGDRQKTSNSTFFHNLTPTQIQNLSHDEIRNLEPRYLKDASLEQLKALSEPQVEAFTFEQVCEWVRLGMVVVHESDFDKYLLDRLNNVTEDAITSEILQREINYLAMDLIRYFQPSQYRPPELPVQEENLDLKPMVSKLKKCVGEGKFGKVWRDPSDKKYVIKAAPVSKNPNSIAIEKEVVFFSQYYGSGSAKYLGKFNGNHYSRMLRVPGLPLGLWCYSRELHALFPLSAIDAIKKLHGSLIDCGIQHGDLNMDNIFYDRESDKCYPIDFGLAQRIPDAGDVALKGLSERATTLLFDQNQSYRHDDSERLAMCVSFIHKKMFLNLTQKRIN